MVVQVTLTLPHALFQTALFVQCVRTLMTDIILGVSQKSRFRKSHQNRGKQLKP